MKLSSQARCSTRDTDLCRNTCVWI